MKLYLICQLTSLALRLTSRLLTCIIIFLNYRFIPYYTELQVYQKINQFSHI